MRASRLLTILMTLQARGRATAGELAGQCGVSLRTVYRDMDTLSGLGIPLYSDRGAEGGYRLLDGYRTRLNGLSGPQAEALFLAGLTGPAADLGLADAASEAQLKLLAALPANLRAGAERMRATFHLDAPGWFSADDQPAWLPDIARAVWEQHCIRVRYQSWKGERERRLAPLGLVLKGGAWYLVASAESEPRTYKVSRIRDFDILDDHFERPRGFDLAAHWHASTQRLERELHTNRAEVRLSPQGLKMLPHLTAPYVSTEAVIEPRPDAQGWYHAVLPVGSESYACMELSQFGPELEIVGPPELRKAMHERVANMAALYHTDSAPSTENNETGHLVSDRGASKARSSSGLTRPAGQAE